MRTSILVVDDSATVRKFVTLSLEMQGFLVVGASDGSDALEKMAEHNVGLVITDLNMPQMDGLELIASLRENPLYTELPVIILSSLDEALNKATVATLGVHSYLRKPLNCQRIQYEVAKYLNSSETAHVQFTREEMHGKSEIPGGG